MVSDREEIEVEDLPERIRDTALAANAVGLPALSEDALVLRDPREAMNANGLDYYGYMRALEGKVLSELYARYDGSVSQMSRGLKISRSHLYSKLSAHRIIN
jgi:transcriptional regulator of acetoin/glycerol metabolism